MVELKMICPELADPMKEVLEVIRHFKTSPAWQRAKGLDELLDKTELKLTFSEVQAIAARMLALAEDLEEARGQTFEAMIEKAANARVKAMIKIHEETKNITPAGGGKKG